MNPRLKGLSGLCLVGDVAAVLDWDPRTVRKYLIPMSEWSAQVADDPDFYTRRVPYLLLGDQTKIPVFWLEGVFARASGAEPDS